MIIESSRARIWRLLIALTAIPLLTLALQALIPANAITAGFVYLLFVLIVASTWGFLEAALASILATFAFNYFFLPPLRTFTIADPQNWVALVSFLATSLIAGRLSTVARQRTVDAVGRQQDIERLYAFSRAILLIESADTFAKQLAQKAAEIFELDAVVLYDRRTGNLHRAGPVDFDGMEEQLRQAALQGTTFHDPLRRRVITAVRLGADPIASLALQGAPMPDSALQGVANLIAIGLERARAQNLTAEVEAARQTERLRTALIDAMAHEFKTPLTSIRAATSSLLDNPQQPEESRNELVKIADEEAERLKDLIDNAVEMARLDAAHIDIRPERANLRELVEELLTMMHSAIDGRPVQVSTEPNLPDVALDRRLAKLAIKQLIDNALKYSPPNTPVMIRIRSADDAIGLEVIDSGAGIPAHEQPRVFQRFYRGDAMQKKIPGSGLGLSIAHRIVQAHGGDLSVVSQPGETIFRMTLPLSQRENT